MFGWIFARWCFVFGLSPSRFARLKQTRVDLLLSQCLCVLFGVVAFSGWFAGQSKGSHDSSGSTCLRTSKKGWSALTFPKTKREGAPQQRHPFLPDPVGLKNLGFQTKADSSSKVPGLPYLHYLFVDAYYTDVSCCLISGPPLHHFPFKSCKPRHPFIGFSRTFWGLCSNSCGKRQPS